METLKKRILLIEDDKLSQKVARLILTSSGCLVDVAENGKIALEKIAQCYDMVFLDLGLPDMSGITIAQKIRATSNSNQHIPIIALSANDESSIKSEITECGMNDFLVKPLDSEKAKAILKKYFL